MQFQNKKTRHQRKRVRQQHKEREGRQFIAAKKWQQWISIVIRSSRSSYVLDTGSTFHNVTGYHPIFRFSRMHDHQGSGSSIITRLTNYNVRTFHKLCRRCRVPHQTASINPLLFKSSTTNHTMTFLYLSFEKKNLLVCTAAELQQSLGHICSCSQYWWSHNRHWPQRGFKL